MWGTLDGFKKYLGEKYLDTRGAERKQQLSHFQTFGCLPRREEIRPIVLAEQMKGEKTERHQWSPKVLLIKTSLCLLGVFPMILLPSTVFYPLQYYSMNLCTVRFALSDGIWLQFIINELMLLQWDR